MGRASTRPRRPGFAVARDRARREEQTWMGIFFLFLASMATSLHPSVLLYLVVFLSLTVVLMVRFVYLHVLASFGHRDLEPPRLPVRAFLVGAVAATLLLAVPLFAVLPRVRSPYIMAPGGGGGQPEARAGFSDAMSLDLIGRIRDNRQIALRLAFTGATSPPPAMRFKAATYDVWQGRTWRRSGAARTLRRNPREGTFRLAAGTRAASVQVALEPLLSTSLILPMEALAVDLDLAVLDLDRGRTHCNSVSIKLAAAAREPWLLSCSPGLARFSAETIVHLYAQRMKIEQSFRDTKNASLEFRVGNGA